ncbi:unnamed protein product [Mytilus coruscus]|uniref:Uncharacterized protein n=1 Tax=Mytilus coruscus TaxID=42192 RepID=A0A6J8DAS0_MYTCO|nr:unnamed protein product [Mytilus coruscus]
MLEEETLSESFAKMSLQDKLDYVDHEIRLLHQFCKQTGYSAHKINEFAEPFVVECKKGQRKYSFRILSLMTCIVVLFGIVSYALVSHPFGQALIRITAIQFYPLYEWMQIHNNDCLVKNPLFVDQYLTEEDCQLCSDITDVKRISDLTEVQFVAEFMKTGQHVIVKDGMRDWLESMTSLTIGKIKDIYQKDPAFFDSEPCDLSTNLPYQDVDEFMEEEHKIKQGYYISWTNCVKQTAKAMRRFYKRPYFLPSSVEMFEQNFIYFSKKYKHKEIVEFKTETAIIILLQLKGRSTFNLFPEDLCNTSCIPIQDTLNEGQILIAMNTHKVWTLDIQGTDGEENIAIGIEGNFN